MGSMRCRGLQQGVVQQNLDWALSDRGDVLIADTLAVWVLVLLLLARFFLHVIIGLGEILHVRVGWDGYHTILVCSMHVQLKDDAR